MFNARHRLWIALAGLLSLPVLAQQETEAPALTGQLDPQLRIQEIRQPERRELTVLAPTLPPEEMDRAVLNRLMQEIVSDPDTARDRLGVSANELQDIYITISNARSFINNNEMANVRAMCRAWNNSELEGDARIQAALDAYKARARFTTNFIARYYRVVLNDIESALSAPSRTRFNGYMEDRRRRLANAPAVTFGAVVENVSSGAESVQFHCRRNQ